MFYRYIDEYILTSKFRYFNVCFMFIIAALSYIVNDYDDNYKGIVRNASIENVLTHEKKSHGKGILKPQLI